MKPYRLFFEDFFFVPPFFFAIESLTSSRAGIGHPVATKTPCYFFFFLAAFFFAMDALTPFRRGRRLVAHRLPPEMLCLLCPPPLVVREVGVELRK